MSLKNQWITISHLFLGFIALTSTQAAPITIDDFSTDQTVSAGGSGFVDDPGILGGQRDVIANGAGTTFNAAGSAATMTATGSNFVMLDYDGMDDNAGVSSFLLGDIDLTAGGVNDRFFLNITSVTGSVQATVRVAESLTAYSEGSFTVSAADLYAFAFTSLSNVGAGGDVTAAKRVFLRFNLDQDEAVTIDNFYVGASGNQTTVPEPSTVALFGLGLFAVAALRNKRAA